MIPKWAGEIKPEDIQNETMRDMADIIGVPAMLSIVETYSGMVLYIPKVDSVVRAARDRLIRAEFDGKNSRKLALKYDVSESYLWRIVNEKQLVGQIGMFDS